MRREAIHSTGVIKGVHVTISDVRALESPEYSGRAGVRIHYHFNHKIEEIISRNNDGTFQSINTSIRVVLSQWHDSRCG